MTAPTSVRQVWDAAAAHRAQELSRTVDDYLRQGLTPDAAAKAAQDDAALILASATQFADAVDRSARHLAYEDAVLIEGSAGLVVCSEAEWRASPHYWRTVAAGGAGRVDRVEVGRLLLHYLRTGDNLDDDEPGAHRA